MPRLFIQILAVLLILLGLVVLPLPIPFGGILLAAGLTILIASSASFAAALKARRLRHAFLHRLLYAIEERAPRCIRAILERSDPSLDDSVPPLSEAG